MRRATGGASKAASEVGAQVTSTTYPGCMSVAENREGSSHLTVVTAKEALQRAKPLPGDDDMAVEGLTDDEWDAFEQALADR
jgi:hypothetical protein